MKHNQQQHSPLKSERICTFLVSKYNKESIAIKKLKKKPKFDDRLTLYTKQKIYCQKNK